MTIKKREKEGGEKECPNNIYSEVYIVHIGRSDGLELELRFLYDPFEVGMNCVWGLSTVHTHCLVERLGGEAMEIWCCQRPCFSFEVYLLHLFKVYMIME